MPGFTIEMGLAHPDGGEPAPVTAVVDTGADHSMMPQSLPERLGIAPGAGAGSASLRMMASYRIAAMGWPVPVSMAWNKPCPVVFGSEGADMPGASALEIFNLEEDRAGGRPVPAEELSLGRGGKMDDAFMIAPPQQGRWPVTASGCVTPTGLTEKLT